MYIKQHFTYIFITINFIDNNCLDSLGYNNMFFIAFLFLLINLTVINNILSIKGNIFIQI